MPHHIYVALPDGQQVVANWQDLDAVRAMRRYLLATVEGREPQPQDVAAIRQWYASNKEQSRLCASGRCDHQ